MFENFLRSLTPEVITGGLLIFFMRCLDMSMDTLRVLFVVRGKKSIVWILGVVQNIIYISAISSVLSGEKNPFTVLCYACGYATGNIIGMMIEEKLAIGFKHLTVTSREKGDLIAEALRERGFGATQMAGMGMKSDVAVISTYVKRKQVAEVQKIVMKIDEDAFITVDDLSPLSAGHWKE